MNTSAKIDSRFKCLYKLMYETKQTGPLLSYMEDVSRVADTLSLESHPLTRDDVVKLALLGSMEKRNLARAVLEDEIDFQTMLAASDDSVSKREADKEDNLEYIVIKNDEAVKKESDTVRLLSNISVTPTYTLMAPKKMKRLDLLQLGRSDH